MTDRRAYFFLGAALVVAATYPLIPPSLNWTALALAMTYLVFAALFAAASISSKRNAKRNGQGTSTL